MNKLKFSCAAAALLLAGAQPAFATTTTATFTVTASVVAACTSLSASNISFGNIVGGQSSSATGTIFVICANGTPYTVDLDEGLGANAFVGRRLMSAGLGTSLIYNIFTDAAHSTIWGTQFAGGTTVSGVGSGSSQQITTYAMTSGFNSFTGQASPIGNYTDTVTVTLSF